MQFQWVKHEYPPPADPDWQVSRDKKGGIVHKEKISLRTRKFCAMCE